MSHFFGVGGLLPFIFEETNTVLNSLCTFVHNRDVIILILQGLSVPSCGSYASHCLPVRAVVPLGTLGSITATCNLPPRLQCIRQSKLYSPPPQITIVPPHTMPPAHFESDMAGPYTTSRSF